MSDFARYTIDVNSTVRDALIKLNALSGDVLTLFVMDGKRLIGTLTDGDVRRFLIINDTLNVLVDKLMKRNFCFIRPGENNVQKIKNFRLHGIKLLPCINEFGELMRIFDLENKETVLPIDAVLMAGGKGERLRPLTEKTPKPLLKIEEKAIIDYNVDHLIRYGVERIYV